MFCLLEHHNPMPEFKEASPEGPATTGGEEERKSERGQESNTRKERERERRVGEREREKERGRGGEREGE